MPSAEPRPGAGDAGCPPPPPPGTRFGRFLSLETLGVGSMGLVLAAYDPELRRRVALKILRPTEVAAEARERARLGLLHDVRAMARITHPHVVTVYEVGSVGEQTYVAMELVAGETLRAWLDRAPPWQEIVLVFLAAGRGLAAAHAAGLVHRDFKPDNVLLGKDGRVRVSDVGLPGAGARALASHDPELRREIQGGELLRGLTVEGRIVGTPVYMAPEQHDGARVDARSDQFAFCVSLFEALHGVRPFGAARYPELAAQVRQGRIRELARGGQVPAWLTEVARRGLSARPEDRYPDMRALLRELGHQPDAVRRRRLGALSLALLTGIALWVALRGGAPGAQRCTGARERLVGVWDAPVRARLEKAFRGTKEPYAPDTFDRVARRLADYAERWAAVHTETCRATHVSGQQSERLLDLLRKHRPARAGQGRPGGERARAHRGLRGG